MKLMPDRPLPRLLIVDDEEALMRALASTLKDQGFETEGFTKGDDALIALRSRKFDLMLCDLMMPEMDGIAVLRAALQIEPDLFAIIMTGAGTIASAVEAMKTGAFDYILKPFKLNAVLPVLSRALSMRNLRLRNRALEAKVRQRTAQLEAVNKELEAYSYTVSHDLRAPLRHITSFGQFMASSKDTVYAEKDRQYLDRILHAAGSMSKMIEELLTFARMSEIDLRPIPIEVESLLDEIMRHLQPEMEGRNIVWKRQPIPELYGDLGLLRQVFVNLLMNAIKYSRGRNPAEIEIGSQNDSPDEIIVYVKDNGTGFDMQYANKLFGVFQRLHRQDEFEGTGVGLASVRRIIGRHGGRVWAEGKPGQGATFFFSLPRKSAAES